MTGVVDGARIVPVPDVHLNANGWSRGLPEIGRPVLRVVGHKLAAALLNRPDIQLRLVASSTIAANGCSSAVSSQTRRVRGSAPLPLLRSSTAIAERIPRSARNDTLIHRRLFSTYSVFQLNRSPPPAQTDYPQPLHCDIHPHLFSTPVQIPANIPIPPHTLSRPSRPP